MTRFAWFLLAGFLFGLAFAACSGGSTTCSSANCGGCCTAEGKCESGTSAQACGLNGASCGRCGAGTVCQATTGTCQASNTGGGANPDGLGIEVVYPNDVGPTAPFMYTINNDSYFQCSVCSVFYESCNSNMVCDKTYLARSGTVQIDRADRAPAGRMIGHASTLHYVEWDLGADMPVANGACVDVGSVPNFNVGWNQDGGAPPP